LADGVHEPYATMMLAAGIAAHEDVAQVAKPPSPRKRPAQKAKNPTDLRSLNARISRGRESVVE